VEVPWRRPQRKTWISVDGSGCSDQGTAQPVERKVKASFGWALLTNDFRLVPGLHDGPRPRFFGMQSGRGEREPYCQLVGNPNKAMAAVRIRRYKTCLCSVNQTRKNSSSDPHAKGAGGPTAPLLMFRSVQGILAVGLAAVVNDRVSRPCQLRARRETFFRKATFGLAVAEVRGSRPRRRACHRRASACAS